MELCTSLATSNFSHPKLFRPNCVLLRSTTSLPLKRNTISHKNPGLHYFATPFLRATTSEETSTSVNEQLKEASDGVTIVEETPIILKNEQNALYEAPMDEPLQSFVHMLDLEDAYPILLYGGGALVAVWLASVLVGAFDSIPLFSKVMEVVGIAYTIWFTTRYLIFKKNRNELSEKIEELKEQVLGSTDD
ncbi:PREDICTED: protein CURVATURE THYLAKOID 1D, chloroplastic-like isoform X2 [Nelumbo nucifera]|uniref:Protein CURVATURE THYLAKOID 1D, chloroplastic-like isoform X2 n=1 Tax=Nelumbo nucifera TaxID=4432 RepID=A0A1U8B1B3_NELNU|nr:PREDICTED: protein CURVATURE THYLAKOID 1D, chloroplastic-like isoform X2 [Nelumbo nucifera]